MRSVVITEKPSVEKKVRAAVGDKYGLVLAARGHLLSLKEPGEVNPEWQSWGLDVLKPDGFYPSQPAKGMDADQKKRLDRIGVAMKTASVVIIATDSDREGQVIGDELVDFFKFKGKVERVMIAAESPGALRSVFEARQPNSKYHGLGQAGFVRQQADQVYNLTVTRAATVTLRHADDGAVVGVGRVKTPTLGIVCRRELEILNFKPETYFEVAATIVPSGDPARAFKAMHQPDPRIQDKAAADKIRAAAEGAEGPLQVEQRAGRQGPPKLPDLGALQKAAGPWGWPVSKVEKIAQALYNEHELTTYPRSDQVHAPEEIIPRVPEMLDAFRAVGVLSVPAPADPVVRRGAKGHFCDKCLEGQGHYAIIPNVDTMSVWPSRAKKLTADERRLFDYICKRFMAAVWPDHEFLTTSVSLDANGHRFAAKGKTVTVNGWKDVFPVGKDEDGVLPALRNGEVGRVADAVVEGKQTRPPNRFNEGDLTEAMEDAWKYTSDKAKQSQLKEAGGIGRPATRPQIVEELKRQGQLKISGKHIVPTDYGMAIYRIFNAVRPQMVDPGLTAEWEARMSGIVKGEGSAKQMYDEIAEEAGACVAAILSYKGPKLPPSGAAASKGRRVFKRPKPGSAQDRAPSEGQLKYVEDVARDRGLALPEGYKTSSAICSAFLDQHTAKRSGKPAGKRPSGGKPGRKAGAKRRSFGGRR